MSSSLLMTPPKIPLNIIELVANGFMTPISSYEITGIDGMMDLMRIVLLACDNILVFHVS